MDRNSIKECIKSLLLQGESIQTSLLSNQIDKYERGSLKVKNKHTLSRIRTLVLSNHSGIWATAAGSEDNLSSIKNKPPRSIFETAFI